MNNRIKDRIVTERGFRTWPSWHVVYEWEDVFSKAMQTGLLYIKYGFVHKVCHRILRNQFLGKISFRTDSERWRLGILMSLEQSHLFQGKNVIPIYLDVKESSINQLVNETKKLPIYFVTSYDVYKIICDKTVYKNCRYIPLSVSDIYYSVDCPLKEIDVIQLGRKNPVLHKYMLDFCNENPEVEYVYQTENGSLTYVSTINGNLGKFDTRKEFMDMLKKAKVSLVSSPSADKSRDFGNIDFFTPRFYESAACYCHMIGRYTQNKECKIIEIDQICTNVESYGEFKIALNAALAKKNSDNVANYKKFLDNNVTSKRVKTVLSALEENGFKI